MAEKRDYYQILGVGKTASADEIASFVCEKDIRIFRVLPDAAIKHRLRLLA